MNQQNITVQTIFSAQEWRLCHLIQAQHASSQAQLSFERTGECQVGKRQKVGYKEKNDRVEVRQVEG